MLHIDGKQLFYFIFFFWGEGGGTVLYLALETSLLVKIYRLAIT